MESKSYRYFTLTSLPERKVISIFRFAVADIGSSVGNPSLSVVREEVARLILKDLKRFIDLYPLDYGCWSLDFSNGQIKVRWSKVCHGEHWSASLFEATISTLFYGVEIEPNELGKWKTMFLVSRLMTFTPGDLADFLAHREIHTDAQGAAIKIEEVECIEA